MAKKEVNELECECGHVAGAPATLRIHQATHGTDALDAAIEKATEEVVKVKKVAKRKK